jgi:hypothetical protein
MASVFPDVGRAFLAQAAKLQASNIYVAMGSGSAGWDTTMVDPTTGLTALQAEIGRRPVYRVAYAATTGSGSPIVTDLGTFYETATPTNYLYVLGQFEYADGADETMREIGIFGGVTVQAGQEGNFVSGAQVTNAGRLMAVTRFEGIVKSPTLKYSFEFVIEL